MQNAKLRIKAVKVTSFFLYMIIFIIQILHLLGLISTHFIQYYAIILKIDVEEDKKKEQQLCTMVKIKIDDIDRMNDLLPGFLQ